MSEAETYRKAARIIRGMDSVSKQFEEINNMMIRNNLHHYSWQGPSETEEVFSKAYRGAALVLEQIADEIERSSK